MHIKDLRDLTDKESQCVVGEGEMPMVEILKQLKKMNYQGYANLEYEIDKYNPLNGMKQSFAYMRRGPRRIGSIALIFSNVKLWARATELINHGKSQIND